MRVSALALALIVPVSAMAQQQPGSVEYFIMHNDARQQMHRVCGMQAVYSAECRNMQKADEYIMAAKAKQQVDQGRFGVGSVDSPLYFNAHPIGRNMVLNQCAHPDGSIFQPDAAECAAARISAGK